jgi:hypothetical protein
MNNMFNYLFKIKSNVWYIMPVKGIGHSNYTSRPMEKTTSMSKHVADHGNKTNYNKVGK